MIALRLYLARCHHSGSDSGTTLTTLQRRQFLKRNRPYLYLNINTVEQRPGYPSQILFYYTRRTGALLCRMIIIPTWTWIHRGNKHKARRILHRIPRSRYADMPILQRLAQHFQHRTRKLRELVHEQNTIMSQGYFARHRIIASANQRHR